MPISIIMFEFDNILKTGKYQKNIIKIIKHIHLEID